MEGGGRAVVEPPLLKVTDLVKHFPLEGGILKRARAMVRAVDGVSLELGRGESFGLVGESGCGKTTLGRLILRLTPPTSGRISLEGSDLLSLRGRELRKIRQKLQIIFQDPYSCLDPRMKVGAIISQPLKSFFNLSRAEIKRRSIDLLDKVGLREADLVKYPHEFSGGQRQRIGIARALAGEPELIVADEPVSALDVSIQAQVINLMMDLKAEFDLSYLFISHDLSVVTHVSDRIGVMYLGRIVELAPAGAFTERSRHPYTQALLTAVPQPDPHLVEPPSPLEGDVPNPIDPPSGCSFHPRCPYAMDVCLTSRPGLREVEEAHLVACWLNQGAGRPPGGKR